MELGRGRRRRAAKTGRREGRFMLFVTTKQAETEASPS
jgi:hypothetical protein